MPLGVLSSSGGSGGGTVPGPMIGGTDGSVLFIHPNDIVAQNNANFYWDPINLRLGIQTNTPTTEFQVVSTISTEPRGIMSSQFSTDASAARIFLQKARGTVASPTTIVTGDGLGRIRFSGYDGTSYIVMGMLDCITTGTIGTNRVPTQLGLWSASDTSPSVLRERIRVQADGNVGINTPQAINTNATSNLTVAGSFAVPVFNIHTSDSPYTVKAVDYTLLCDAALGAMTLNLPAVAGCGARIYTIKKVDSSANTVTIDANGAELIDGALTKVLTAQYQSVQIQSDDSTWIVLAVSGPPTATSDTVASSATPTINTNNTRIFTITALATAITSMTTNLSGTPAIGQSLTIRILDNGTARAITWGASFASRGATLPTTTILSKYLYVGFLWNSITSTWDCVAVSQE